MDGVGFHRTSSGLRGGGKTPIDRCNHRPRERGDLADGRRHHAGWTHFRRRPLLIPQGELRHLLDPPAAEHDIAVVTDGRLAGGDGVLGFVELDADLVLARA